MSERVFENSFDRNQILLESLINQVEILVIKTGLTVMQAISEVLGETSLEVIAEEKQALQKIFQDLFENSVYKS